MKNIRLCFSICLCLQVITTIVFIGSKTPFISAVYQFKTTSMLIGYSDDQQQTPGLVFFEELKVKHPESGKFLPIFKHSKNFHGKLPIAITSRAIA